MTPRTQLLSVLQRKLRESEFFMRQMEVRAARPIGNQAEFGHYLSAFLSATRTITDQLENREWGPWLEQWRKSRAPSENELIDLMSMQRNAEVHRAGADVSTTWERVSLADLPNPGGKWWGGVPTVGVATRSFTRGEVLPTCREFLSVLAELVRAFETV